MQQPHPPRSGIERVLANDAGATSPRPARGPNEPASTPPVSVVVAVYNVEQYLSQCLDALTNQTLSDVEVIVVNDASTDASGEIIREYASRYGNIRSIECEKNRGLATVRNIGMAAATGEYVAFADGDDWVDVSMCEAMYRRAVADDADVLIADATVFYDDAKIFGPFFDRHIKEILDAELRARPFSLADDPHVLLVEPVAWTKLYKRSFLQKHKITFEDGMNSYEDMCFHFSVLLKAGRMSLTDDAYAFYRQNRPGQISGRTSRKIFEVFDVFDRIRSTMVTHDAPAEAWAMLAKVQLRQFDWLLKDRAREQHKAEFIRCAAQQIGMLRKDGVQAFTRRATVNELSRFCCLKRGWLRSYEQAQRRPWLMFPLAYLELGARRRGALSKGIRLATHALRRRAISTYRAFLGKSLNLPAIRQELQTVDEGVRQVVYDTVFASMRDETLAKPYEIRGCTLFLSEPLPRSGVHDAVCRMRSDQYLTQTAVYRPGDVIVDVGAHVGVMSIYLAKKHPYVKVLSLEPDPLNFACLKRNIEANGVNNVIAINKAVSANGRDATLYVNAWNNALSTIDADTAATLPMLRTVPVGTVTLEQLFRDHNVRRCRLLKITAPGAVAECLDGLAREHCVDLLCGEVDFADCSRVRLEAASWRIARQHFWRTIDSRAMPPAYSWLHQPPTRMEQEAIDSAATRVEPAPQAALSGLDSRRRLLREP